MATKKPQPNSMAVYRGPEFVAHRARHEHDRVSNMCHIAWRCQDQHFESFRDRPQFCSEKVPVSCGHDILVPCDGLTTGLLPNNSNPLIVP